MLTILLDYKICEGLLFIEIMSALLHQSVVTHFCFDIKANPIS
jgi:hypothetical protein